MRSLTTSPITRRQVLRGLAFTAGAALPIIAARPAAAQAAGPRTAAPLVAAQGANLTMIGSSDDRPYYEYVAKQYQELRGGTVQLITQAYDDTHNKIVTALAGGSNVDLVIVDTIWGAEFAEAGFLHPIDDHLSKEVTDSLVPHALDPWHYNGQQWAVPSSYYFKFYYYNTQKLEQGGVSAPPKTYEELVDTSKALIDKGVIKYGQSWGWTQAEGLICDWQQVMQAFGGDWWDQAGNWTFNQQPAVMALDYMVSNLQTQIFDPSSPTLTDRTTMDVFAKGDTAFMTNWGFAWGLVNDTQQSQVINQVKLTTNPGTKVGSMVSTSCGGGGGFGITENSKAKDEAWELVGLLTSVTRPENDAIKLKMTGAPPVHQAAWSDPQILQDNPHFADVIKQAPYMRHRPTIPWYTEFSKIVQIELTNAFAGAKSPQQALDDAVAAVKAKGNPPVA